MRHASPMQDLVVNHPLQETNNKVFIFFIQVQSFKYEQKPSHIFQTIAKDTSDPALILGWKPHWGLDWALQFMVHSTRIPYAQEEPLWVSPKLPETVRPQTPCCLRSSLNIILWLFPWSLIHLANIYPFYYMLNISCFWSHLRTLNWSFFFKKNL